MGTVGVLLSKFTTGSQSQRSGARINYSVSTRPAKVRPKPSLSSKWHSLIIKSLLLMKASREDTSSVPLAKQRQTLTEIRYAISPRPPHKLQVMNKAANTPSSSSFWAEISQERRLRNDQIYFNLDHCYLMINSLHT